MQYNSRRGQFNGAAGVQESTGKRPWRVMAALGAGIGIAVALGMAGTQVDGETGHGSMAVAAPLVSQEIPWPDTYSIYLVDSAEEAESVQEWAVFGEPIVASGDDDVFTLESTEQVKRFRQRYGNGRIQVFDLRDIDQPTVTISMVDSVEAGQALRDTHVAVITSQDEQAYLYYAVEQARQDPSWPAVRLIDLRVR